MKRFTLIAITCIIILVKPSIAQYPTVEIHHIDVGAGDATLINVRNDGTNISHSILIDAGTNKNTDYVKTYLINNAKQVSSKPYLDYIIASHYHDDHIGGLRGKKTNYTVTGGERDCTKTNYSGVLSNSSGINYFAVLDKGDDKPVPSSYIYKDYKTCAGRRRITVGSTVVGDTGIIVDSIAAPAGTIPISLPDNLQQLSLGGFIYLGADAAGTPIHLRLILADSKVYDPNAPGHMYNVASILQADWPFVDGTVRNMKTNENNWGLGWVLEYGAFRYYTAGDVGGYNSQTLEGCGNYLDIETYISQALPHIYTTPTDAAGHICVQKISHHGSQCSSNQDFLDRAKSSLAIISCGSKHEHPREELIRRLQQTTWNGITSLVNTHTIRYIMTELHEENRTIDLTKGLTSGNQVWVAASNPANEADISETHTMANAQQLYKMKDEIPKKKGNIVVKVYPQNGTPSTSIATKSSFFVEYSLYNGTVVRETINCHQ